MATANHAASVCQRIRQLSDDGFSTGEIADRVERSKGIVRYHRRGACDCETTRACPFCDEPVYRFGDHLPCDESSRLS